MTRRTLLVAVVTAAVALSSCAIQTDDAPRVIPQEERGVFGEEARGDEAAGANRIFLLAPAAPGEAPQLRAVQRDVASNPSALISSLFLGPNADEQAEQLASAIPDSVELNSTRTIGRILTVDMTEGLSDLTPDAVVLAVAQIVATATELDSVQAVRLLINGEEQVWPLGNGGLVDRALTVYDYPGLVESSQPPYPPSPRS